MGHAEKPMFFEDRKEAGKKLSRALISQMPRLKSDKKAIVLALPRGGVPIGFEIAKAVGAPLDVIVAHKLGAPGNPEFAIGALAEDGSAYIDPDSAGFYSKDYLEDQIQRELKEIKNRIKKYRFGQPLPDLKGKTVILVDDGIATGNTMKAAILLARSAKAKRIIAAAPVLPRDTLKALSKEAEVVFLGAPYPFFAIGRFYKNFEQLDDEEVCNYLDEADNDPK